jgi:hypothetical protein
LKQKKWPVLDITGFFLHMSTQVKADVCIWHSQAPTAISNQLEQAYADRLEGQLQEMAVQLHKVYYILIESSFVVIVMATTRDIEPLRI